MREVGGAQYKVITCRRIILAEQRKMKVEKQFS